MGLTEILVKELKEAMDFFQKQSYAMDIESEEYSFDESHKKYFLTTQTALEVMLELPEYFQMVMRREDDALFDDIYGAYNTFGLTPQDMLDYCRRGTSLMGEGQAFMNLCRLCNGVKTVYSTDILKGYAVLSEQDTDGHLDNLRVWQDQQKKSDDNG